MILVTGATGHHGKAVVNGLLKKINPAEIAILVRQEAQAKHADSVDGAIKEGEFLNISGDLEQLTGRKPSNLIGYISSPYSAN